MKTLYFLIIFIFTMQIVDAQLLTELPVSHLKDLGLKGHVKEVTDFDYKGDFKGGNVDTMGTYFRTIMKFDHNGNQTEALEYDNNGNLTLKSLFDYSQEKTIIVSQYSQGDTLIYKHIFKYDHEGNQIECDTYGDNADSILLKYDFKYNSNGKVVEEDILDKNFAYVNKLKFLYNDKYQRIEKDGYTIDSLLYVKTLYEYDKLGNLIKNEDYVLPSNKSAGGDFATYSRIDKNGNWHLKSHQEGFSPNQIAFMTQKGITKRTIIYY